MFNQPSIDDYYRTLQDEIKKEVYSQTDSYLLSVNIDEYADFLFNKHAFHPIEYDTTHEVSIKKLRGYRQVSDYGRDITIEHVSARIRVPVIPNKELDKILELRGSTFSLSPPEMNCNDREIIIEADVNEKGVNYHYSSYKKEMITSGKSKEESGKEKSQEEEKIGL